MMIHASATRGALNSEKVDLPHAGERIRVYRRGLPGDPSGRPVVLMAHGSTYSSGPTFDLPIEGTSMMDILATAGIEVWAMDIVGYGGSSRPAAMAGVVEHGEPVSRTMEAVDYVGTVIDYLLERYDLCSVALLGWSWGSAVMGAYAALRSPNVSCLVQIAPLWLRRDRSVTDPGGRLGAYRIVAVDGVRSRWTTGLHPNDADFLAPVSVVEALQQELLASDLEYSAAHPGHIHVPNGTVADTRQFWAAGKPVYDAGAICCPVLVIAGAWDREWSPDIARSLVNALTKAQVTEIVVPKATHSMLLEPVRHDILSAVGDFISAHINASRCSLFENYKL